MGWRSLVITRPASLKRDHYSLAIRQEEKITVPFEDISVIVLDHPQIALTHPVLSACSEYGIALYSTDDSHLPGGVFIPFLKHTRATKQLRLQMSLSKPLSKQLWADIVRQKIFNQSACLNLGGIEGKNRLEAMVEKVKSGDKTYQESQAAAFYFTQMFGRDFRRSDNRWANSSLNYGYAIFRGAISRSLVSHGFFPSIGLHHSSEQNAFNLSDDLIEPFRPLVDLMVISSQRDHLDVLSTEDKAALVSLLNVDVKMPTGIMNALSAIEYCVESLARAMAKKAGDLLELPQLIGLDQHMVET